MESENKKHLVTITQSMIGCFGCTGRKPRSTGNGVVSLWTLSLQERSRRTAYGQVVLAD